MTHDADQALPRQPLFFAERAAQIGENDELVRAATLPKRTSPHGPPSGTAGETNLHGPRRRAFEAARQGKFFRGQVEQTLRGASQKAFAGAVDQLQFLRVVKREHGHVDLFHDGAQQRRRFERSQPLRAEGLAQGVDLAHHLAERVVEARPAGAHRKILLAHGGEQIGKSLQRKDHTASQRRRKADPEAHDENRKGPRRARGVRAGPQQNQGDQRPRESRSHRQKLDAALVREVLHPHWRSCFCSRRYRPLRLSPSALAARLTLPSYRESVRCTR